MSASLVQKSLRVLKGEEISKKGKQPAIQKKKNHKITQRRTNLIDNNKTKITLIEARNKVDKKKAEQENNLKKLQLLSSGRLNSETAYKVFDRLRKNNIPEAEVSQQPEPTAFTEEDFLKFEQEYFCS